MAQDPYKTLGVTRNADPGKIRAAYRALAKKYHPDRNPGDKTAEDKFKEATAAFEILGDEARKARFDRGEIDADGNPRGFAGGYGANRAGAGPRSGAGARQANRGRSEGAGPFEDINDIFGDFFRNGGGPFSSGRGQDGTPLTGRDICYRMDVDFIEAARGVTKRVTMPNGHSLDITIPEGLRDGQTLRLRGQGEAGVHGGPPGDVYVDVTVLPHRFFELDGDTIRVDVPVTLSEAVKGARIDLPTVHGPVKVKIPPGSSSGTSLRLKGKGIRDPRTDERGDQIARLRLVIPKDDPALQQFVENWDGDQNLSPRQKLK